MYTVFQDRSLNSWGESNQSYSKILDQPDSLEIQRQPRQTFQNQDQFLKWTSAWFLSSAVVHLPLRRPQLLCTVALYSLLRDFSTIWQGLYKTSCGLWKIWSFHCYRGHSVTILLSEFNQHAYNAYYNFGVQMATGPLLRDIYGHRQYRFYSEQSGCDFYGLLVSDCEKTDRRYFPESALQRRDIQKWGCICTAAECAQSLASQLFFFYTQCIWWYQATSWDTQPALA